MQEELDHDYDNDIEGAARLSRRLDRGQTSRAGEEGMFGASAARPARDSHVSQVDTENTGHELGIEEGRFGRHLLAFANDQAQAVERDRS